MTDRTFQKKLKAIYGALLQAGFSQESLMPDRLTIWNPAAIEKQTGRPFLLRPPKGTVYLDIPGRRGFLVSTPAQAVEKLRGVL